MTASAAPTSLKRADATSPSGPVARLAPEAKVVGTVAFVTVVALTPRHLVGAFVLDAALLAAVVALARLPVRTVAARLVVLVPIFLVASLIPFVASGEQTQLGPFSVSVAGLWGAWNVVAKASLGATASVVLAATTPVPDLLVGLTRLRVPTLLVAIVAAMVRQLELTMEQVQRSRTAMAARAHDPRWLWQVRPLTSAAGTLFVRAYERSERTHHAMVARGFDGTMPELQPRRSQPAGWLLALTPAVLAALGAVTGAVGVVGMAGPTPWP